MPPGELESLSSGGVTLSEKLVEAFLATAMLALILIAVYAASLRPNQCLRIAALNALSGAGARSLELRVRNECRQPVRLYNVTVESGDGNIVAVKDLRGYRLEPGETAYITLRVPGEAPLHARLRVVYAADSRIESTTLMLW